MCIRNRHSKFASSHSIYNAEKDTFHTIDCKSWSCPECAPKKKLQMRKGLLNHFKDNRGMRMLTLTCQNGGLEPIPHALVMQKAYHYFIKNIRRCHSMTKQQNEFKYVRCIELHPGGTKAGHNFANAGFVHYHIMIDRFLPVLQLQTLWENALKSAGFVPTQDKFCNAHIVLIPNIDKAISYVIKYITKASFDFGNLLCKWSKSNGTAIFTRDTREGIYFLIKNTLREKYESLYLYSVSRQSPNQQKTNVELII